MRGENWAFAALRRLLHVFAGQRLGKELEFYMKCEPKFMTERTPSQFPAEVTGSPPDKAAVCVKEAAGSYSWGGDAALRIYIFFF